MGLFGKDSVEDAVLGRLLRKGGCWRGSVTLEAPVPLALAGSRQAPDPAALAQARRVAADFAAGRALITAALLEHRAALVEGPAPVDPWPEVRIVFVAVMPVSGMLVTEIGLQVAWDDDHTLGARLHDGALLELNGSVLAP